MAEYLIQGETLTDLADKIRILSGTEETMTPAEMQSNLDTANAEASNQRDIIAQIIDTLGMNEVPVISFIVHKHMGDVTTFVYQAEDWMTWVDWVGSSYNTNGFFVNVDAIVDSDWFGLYTPSEDALVDINAKIIAGATYHLYY